MVNPVRILHLDDNPLDAQLIAYTLEAEREKFSCVVTYVQTKEAYLSSLERKDFDIILSDYGMPSFDGDQALAAALEMCPDIPFIMVTGELGEERVIETLQRGATDYVLKDRIFRLIPAIRRAMDVAELKRDQERAEVALRESEERFRVALASEYFMLAQTDSAARYTWIHPPDRESANALGKLDSELDSSEESKNLEQIKLGVLRSGVSFKGELAVRRGNDVYHYEMIIEPRRDAVGSIIGLTMAGLDITERKRSEGALRQSRETLALAVKATNLGLFDYYPQDDLLLWNDEAREHFGLSTDVPVNVELFLSGVHPDDRERVRSTLREVLRPGSSGSCRLEYRAIGLLDQKERWLDSRGQVFTDEEGEPIRFIGTTNDITSKKRVEQALQAHEETMEAFFDASPAILNILDENLCFIHTDRLTPTYYGLDRQSIIGQSLLSLNPQFVKEYVEPVMKRVLENEEPEFNVEVSGPVPSRKGSVAFWQMAFFPVSLPGKKQGLGIIGIETTELEVAQQKLRQLQELYRLLVEQQTDLVVKISRSGKYLYANKNFLDTMGKTEAEVINSDFVPKIHPDDVASVAEKWTGMFKPPDFRSSIEARMMTVAGWRWLSWRNTAVMDDDGEPSTAICVGRDITERKEAEEELARRESRFCSLISSSSEPIALVDEHGKLLAISRSGAEILGSPASELVNSDVHHFVPPAHLDALGKSLLRLTARPDTPQFVLMRLQMDGKPNLWVELEATAITAGEEIHAYLFRLRPVLLGE